MTAAKAWIAALTAPAVIVIMYALGQMPFVAGMPSDVRSALATVLTLMLGGIATGIAVYVVPNRAKAAMILLPLLLLAGCAKPGVDPQGPALPPVDMAVVADATDAVLLVLEQTQQVEVALFAAGDIDAAAHCQIQGALRIFGGKARLALAIVRDFSAGPSERSRALRSLVEGLRHVVSAVEPHLEDPRHVVALRASLTAGSIAALTITPARMPTEASEAVLARLNGFIDALDRVEQLATAECAGELR